MPYHLRSFGIINANLAVDYTASEDCTWHMWRNALMEVSTVNLVRGQFLETEWEKLGGRNGGTANGRWVPSII